MNEPIRPIWSFQDETKTVVESMNFLLEQFLCTKIFQKWSLQASTGLLSLGILALKSVSNRRENCDLKIGG